jgi:hypothetical protein
MTQEWAKLYERVQRGVEKSTKGAAATQQGRGPYIADVDILRPAVVRHGTPLRRVEHGHQTLGHLQNTNGKGEPMRIDPRPQ